MELSTITLIISEIVDRPVIIYPINNTEAKDFAPILGACVKNTMGTKNNYKCYSKKGIKNPKADYYGVIRGAVRSGCEMAFIIEHSFHTNTASTKWLLQDSILKAMAKAEAKVIADYYGYKKGEQESDSTDNTNESEGTFEMKLNVLRRGSKGEQVKSMQILLEGKGHSVGKYGYDGSFGSATETAVKKLTA